MDENDGKQLTQQQKDALKNVDGFTDEIFERCTRNAILFCHGSAYTAARLTGAWACVARAR